LCALFSFRIFFHTLLRPYLELTVCGFLYNLF
jgi:hypothetical protein